MNLDATAVDEEPVRCIFGPGKRAENILPDATLSPAHEAIAERFPGAINISAIGPAATAFERMDDPAQNPAIINPLHAAHIGWQKRRDPRPLRIGKPKEIRHFQRLLAKGVESYSEQIGNPVIEFMT